MGVVTVPPHAAIDWVEDGRRECRVCGESVTGSGAVLRHVGETFLSTPPDRRHTEGFATSLQRVRSALARLPDDASDDERARAAVEALYRTGMLRQRQRI